MKILLREHKDGPVLRAELTPEERNTIFRALYHSKDERAKKLREDLCGSAEMIISFDGNGKNGL